MKAADLHNGIKRALQGLQSTNTTCSRCRRGPIARFQTSLPIRQFSISARRSAEDDRSRITTDEARIADTELNDPVEVEDAVVLEDFKAAPEIDLNNSDFDAIVSFEEDSARDGENSSNSELDDMRNQRAQSRLPEAKKPLKRNVPISRLRVVPASPSYFTSRPNFTDHYLEISALYRRHQLLPTGGRTETKITWLSLAEYKAMIGDEPVAAGRYRQLIKMCQKLSSINIHLMPDEVHNALQRFTKEEQPVVKFKRQSQMDEHGRAYGLGRRKAATARAWIVQGGQVPGGNVLVNGKSLSEYFTRVHQRESAIYPLIVTERVGRYNVFAIAQGGGLTGQAEALTLAVAKALLVYEPGMRAQLKAAGCLARDRRRVERKKPGHLKARKKPAWVKR